MTRSEEITKVRDAALAVIRSHGEIMDQLGNRVQFADCGTIRILYRTPFSKLDHKYGLDIWAPKKVLNIQWDRDEAPFVSSFKPGPWELELLRLAA